MSLILLRFACPQCLAATPRSSSPEVGNGLSWPKPQCTCNVMVTSQAQHSTNEGVLRSNSACSMLMSDEHGVVQWVPEQLNIKAVTGSCKLIDGFSLELCSATPSVASPGICHRNKSQLICMTLSRAQPEDSITIHYYIIQPSL